MHFLRAGHHALCLLSPSFSFLQFRSCSILSDSVSQSLNCLHVCYDTPATFNKLQLPSTFSTLVTLSSLATVHDDILLLSCTLSVALFLSQRLLNVSAKLYPQGPVLLACYPRSILVHIHTSLQLWCDCLLDVCFPRPHSSSLQLWCGLCLLMSANFFCLSHVSLLRPTGL